MEAVERKQGGMNPNVIRVFCERIRNAAIADSALFQPQRHQDSGVRDAYDTRRYRLDVFYALNASAGSQAAFSGGGAATAHRETRERAKLEGHSSRAPPGGHEFSGFSNSSLHRCE